jgi:hypothetical protein
MAFKCHESNMPLAFSARGSFDARCHRRVLKARSTATRDLSLLAEDLRMGASSRIKGLQKPCPKRLPTFRVDFALILLSIAFVVLAWCSYCLWNIGLVNVVDVALSGLTHVSSTKP